MRLRRFGKFTVVHGAAPSVAVAAARSSPSLFDESIVLGVADVASATASLHRHRRPPPEYRGLRRQFHAHAAPRRARGFGDALPARRLVLQRPVAQFLSHRAAARRDAGCLQLHGAGRMGVAAGALSKHGYLTLAAGKLGLLTRRKSTRHPQVGRASRSRRRAARVRSVLERHDERVAAAAAAGLQCHLHAHRRRLRAKPRRREVPLVRGRRRCRTTPATVHHLREAATQQPFFVGSGRICRSCSADLYPTGARCDAGMPLAACGFHSRGTTQRRGVASPSAYLLGLVHRPQHRPHPRRARRTPPRADDDGRRHRRPRMAARRFERGAAAGKSPQIVSGLALQNAL